MRQQQQDGVQSKVGLQWLLFFLDCFAFPHELLMRIPSTVGPDYPGLWVRLGGLCALPLYFCFSPPSYGASWLVLWWYLLIVLVVIRMIARFWYPYDHSYYIGDSWAWRIQPSLRANRRRLLPELALAICLAFGLMFLCDTLAKFVLVSALCSSINLILIHERDRRMLQELRNQHAEAERFYERI
jgi:hypothetical protein